MKKNFFILGVSLLFGMFCACSSDDGIPVVGDGQNTVGSIGNENDEGENSEVTESGEDGDEKTDSIGSESYISGTIQLIDHEELGKYVFIGGLKMPEGDDKFSYIETVVVPKDEFPLQDYHSGDIISFIIVEVKSEFPNPFRDAMHSYPPSTQYLCSIELCE